MSFGPLAGWTGLPLVRLGRQRAPAIWTQDAVPLPRLRPGDVGSRRHPDGGVASSGADMADRDVADGLVSKGISARQLGFWLRLQYRTAWQLSHRIRRMDSHSAPRSGAMQNDGPVLCGVVEMDETYFGGDPRAWSTGDDDSDGDDCGDGPGESRPKGRGTSKPLLLTAVERGGSTHARPIESYLTDAITTRPASLGRSDDQADDGCFASLPADQSGALQSSDGEPFPTRVHPERRR